MIKKTLSALIALILMLAILPAAPAALAESDGMVRVKLTRLGSPKTIVFTTGCAYYINNTASDKIASGSTVSVTLSGGKLTIKSGSIDKTFTDSFTLNRKKAGTSGVKFTTPSMANQFCGDFKFSKSSGSIMTVMTIYVEDYLYGVVGYEMSNSYPIESLKAQAVAARNYALRCKATRASREYDLTDTSSDQVFKGYNSSYANIIKAVDKTRGVTLYYGSAMASCYYAASNGGQTESTKNAWGSKLAYSIVKDDPYDLESGATFRAITLKKNQAGETMNGSLRAALLAGITDKLEKYECSTASADVTINGIESIEPIEPKYAAPSILYTKLRFTISVTTKDSNGEPATGKATVDIPTYGGFEDWFNLSINSGSNETIFVDDAGDGFTVTFRRWGHGIGMSQRGARIMAKNYSMDYAAILYFYYPGTDIKTLTLPDKTGAGLNGADDDDIGDWGKPIDQVYVNLSDAAGTLKMRKSPSTDAEVLVKLNHNTVVDLYKIDNDWAAIGYREFLGYVPKQYLAAIDEGDPTPQPTATPVPTPTPAPTASPTPAPTATAETYVKVKVSGKNARLILRQKASTSSKVVAKLKNGKTLKVLGYKGKWVKVQTSAGKKGFVYKKYVRYIKNPTATAAPTVAPTATPTAIKATVKTDTFLYKKSDVNSGAIKGLSKGDSVNVLVYSDAWAYVEAGSDEGYVQTKYLKKVS